MNSSCVGTPESPALSPLFRSCLRHLAGPLWPAYRGMFGLGLICFALSLVLMLIGSAISGATGAAIGFALAWIAISVTLGFYGTAAYQSYVARRIRDGGDGPGLLGPVGVFAFLALSLSSLLFVSGLSDPEPMPGPRIITQRIEPVGTGTDNGDDDTPDDERREGDDAGFTWDVITRRFQADPGGEG